MNTKTSTTQILTNEALKKINYSSLSDIESNKFNVENDIILTAENNKQITGIIQLIPVTNNAIQISVIKYNNAADALSLINNALQKAWELGYDAALSQNNDPILLQVGFATLSPKFSHISNKTLYAYSLTYEGIAKYCSKLQTKLN